jgi:hypothetical protein
MVLLGLGLAFFSSPNTNAAMSAVNRKDYGVASAAIAAMRLVGMMLSMGIIIMILSTIVGRTQITQANHPAFLLSMRIGFIVFAVLCAAGVAASLARGNVARAPTPDAAH